MDIVMMKQTIDIATLMEGTVVNHATVPCFVKNVDASLVKLKMKLAILLLVMESVKMSLIRKNAIMMEETVAYSMELKIFALIALVIIKKLV